MANRIYYLLAVLDSLNVVVCTGRPKLLDDKILHYEPVYYSRESIQHQQQVPDQPAHSVFLNFTAYNRDFQLLLYKDRYPLTSKFSIKVSKKRVKPFDLPSIYSGKVQGYPDSRVYGRIEDGIFQGSIQLEDGLVYYLVPSQKLFADKVDFHTVIYSQDDYQVDSVNTDMKESQTSTAEDLGHYPRRWKRQIPSSFSSPRQDKVESKVCTLKLTADHTVWRHVMNLTNQNEVRTYAHIIYLLSSHVAELNRIYSDFTFPIMPDNSGSEQQYLNLQFHIQDIEILDEECLKPDQSHFGDEFCTTRDPTTLLDFYTGRYDDNGDAYFYYDDAVDYDGADDYSDYYNNGDDAAYCLVFLFTARDLRHKRGKEAFPVLGGAWPLTEDHASGICRRGGNFGFITLCQYGEDRFLSPVVTQLVFAHEVAHTIGALHDDDEAGCGDLSHTTQPDEGFYLMHSIAQNGREANNRRLSNCSMAHMTKTLSNPKYTQCFVTSMEPTCGNKIVEEGEECDCGMAPCDDPCCHGRDPNNTSNSCKLKEGAECSASNGPCCNIQTCKFVSRKQNEVCQNKRPCVDELYCDGERYGAECPPPLPDQIRPDGWHCSQNGRVCDRGSCNKSICDQINWHECQVTKTEGSLSVEDKEELCFLGCQKTEDSECVTSYNETKVQQNPEFAYLLRNMTFFNMPYLVHFPIGWPCNSYKGYCDSYYRCRGMEPDTPLVVLKNCFISGDCFAFIKSHLLAWITLVCFVFVLIPALLAKCCAIHTKSSNPIMERKHPRQTVQQSLHRISSFRESVNLDNLQQSFHNFRNSVNFENLRHSFRGRPGSRPTSQTHPDHELDRLNTSDDADCAKSDLKKDELTLEIDALTLS